MKLDKISKMAKLDKTAKLDSMTNLDKIMKLNKMMNLNKITKYSLAITFISLSGLSSDFSGATKCGAVFGFGFGGSHPAVTEQAATTPQVEAAIKRVDTAKTNLDLARKRMEASKALLKAAEAEYRAAKTDKDALVLNTEAQQLADASGLPKNGENAPAVPGAAASIAGGAAGATSVVNGNGTAAGSASGQVYNSNESTIDFSGAGSPSGAPTP